MRLVVLLCGIAASAQAAPIESPDVEIAHKHFNVGVTYYNSGNYGAALGEFEAARLVQARPGLDYNIARCLERLERYPEAIDAYRRFLARAADEADAKEARERVAVLTDRIARLHPVAPIPVEKPIVVVPPPVTPPQPAHEGRALVAPIAVAVVAVAAIGIGAGLMVSAGQDYDRLHASCGDMCQPSQWQGSRTDEQAGVAMIVVGAVAAAADVALWLLHARSHRTLTATRSGLIFAGSF